MKKKLIVFLALLMVGCSASKKITLKKTVTIEFYSISECAQCQVFKKKALPYFKERYGKKVIIKMYDMDEESTKPHYDEALKHLQEWDEAFYGQSPFLYVKNHFAYLGYNAGDEEWIAKDIEASLNKEKLSKRLEGHRFLYQK
ncbi:MULTISPECIES: hypothetical protein [Kandleria]|jgi:hypothetical protein|nr:MULTISPECIES: hypothetical protein [Kandleria]MEE0988553.1 hypothetical protein [Kandleria vitulina]SDL71049.1 hypothetical protein SAMN05216520_11175 [Kandleria vitulina]SEJ29594.1 hypothetical protein SAMN05216514_1219 [Kandleria vitulina]